MLSEKDLRELIDYRPGHQVISVYLNADPSSGSADAHKLNLRQMLKPFEPDLPADTEAVIRFVDHHYDWSGRSLVLFSCAPTSFFRTYALAVPIRSRTRAHERPYVKPLADLWQSYANCGVALVDQQAARLFHFHLGSLWEEEGTLGEAVRHTKRGGGSQAPGRRGGSTGQTRHAEELADRNLKSAAKFASRFFHEAEARRVMVAGTEANVARFIELLPKKLQSLVIGTFPMEMTASHAQVLERAMVVADQATKEKAFRLVEAVITAAAKGKEGVVRLDDTLEAVHAGRVQTLVVREGFRAFGYRCQGCHYLTTQALPKCPFCGGAFDQIEDAVELAVRKVLEDNGEVEVVRDVPNLERVGSIGGLLRY
jgi:peptide chain release factor subunit 1